MSSIKASQIVKTYGKKEVLHSINLELETGKIYGLIGRNGAGKTTLMSILSAQNPATSGTVTVGKEPVWENPAALEHICFSRELNQMVGNTANSMKVKEYLKIASLFLPHWDREMEQRLVREFQLDTKKRISRLSKGMLSMVTIVVALASKAEFTILDEPVAGLDVVARETFYRLLMEEFTESGRTFVISTHIIEEAANVFEEVILLDEGNILLKENTEELLERAWYVSGREDEVDRATAGYTQHHAERLGRSKGVTILTEPGEAFVTNCDVTVQKVSLQKLFVALCGEEGERNDGKR
ncbi:MAG: ABC transporter ATP-binding protein [Lachnospiraceae bacterium]|nr:ABC transporter ATP-binding protein [Lachnospiraceae bacterium]